jgi:hypothetical protein
VVWKVPQAHFSRAVACDVSRHRGRPNPRHWVRPSLVFSGMCGGGGDRLAAVSWVEHELAEEFAGGGVDDPDVEVLDQDEDAGSGAVRPMPME